VVIAKIIILLSVSCTQNNLTGVIQMTKKIIAVSMLLVLLVIGTFSSVYAVSIPDTIQDVSGNENNASTAGSGVVVSGRYGRGIKFNSNNEYLTVNPNSKKDRFYQDALDLSGEQTIMFWFTPSTSRVSVEKNVYTIQEYGFNKYNAYIYGAAPYAIGNENSKYDASKVLTLSTFSKSGDIKQVSIEKDWQVDKWYHLTATIDPNAGIMKLYINGKLEARESVGAFEVKDSNNGLTIGGARGFYDYTRSKMDEFRIYNRALSDNEVVKVYNTNMPLYDGLLLRLDF